VAAALRCRRRSLRHESCGTPLGGRITGTARMLGVDEAARGTDQVRFYRLDRNVLTLKSTPIKSPVDGREGVGVVVWERVEAPVQ
jgi:hypothetical protein